MFSQSGKAPLCNKDLGRASIWGIWVTEKKEVENSQRLLHIIQIPTGNMWSKDYWKHVKQGQQKSHSLLQFVLWIGPFTGLPKNLMSHTVVRLAIGSIHLCRMYFHSISCQNAYKPDVAILHNCLIVTDVKKPLCPRDSFSRVSVWTVSESSTPGTCSGHNT